MTGNSLIIPYASIVSTGQRAWTRIKTTAAEQRQLWREVGEALLVGRRQNPSNQAFGKWCKDMGFDMDPSTRSNAMWFASWTPCKTLPVELTHPTHIRQWHREQTDGAPVNPDASPDMDLAASTEVLKNHRRYKAVVDHSKGTGPEAETAKRQLKATAKKLGITEAQLEALVDKLDPYHKLLPAKRDELRGFMDRVVGYAKALRQTVENFQGAVTPEFLIAVIAAELKG